LGVFSKGANEMPLFPCPECGHACSTKALACPSCGLPFNQIAEDQSPSLDLKPTQPTLADSTVVSESPLAQQTRSPIAGNLINLGKSSLKVLAIVVAILAVLSIRALLVVSNRHSQIEEVASELAEDNPYLSKSDIIILGNEISRRNLSPDQAKRFTFETFGRGVELLSVSEQEEIGRIREQLFSALTPEEMQRWNSVYAKTNAGQLPTDEEVEYARRLQKKAINSLPEQTKLRCQFLMGKAMRTALNIQ